MNKRRWSSLSLGAVAFFGAHMVERAFWLPYFANPEAPYSAWFTNSGRAVLFTMVCLAAAALIAAVVGARNRHDALVHGDNVAVGAVMTMTVMFFVVIGPSRLFPIAIFLGALLIVVGSCAGTLVTLPFRH